MSGPARTNAPTQDVTRPLRVLIVEDSPEDAETFRRYLEGDPARPRVCRVESLGEGALDALAQETPDCLLVDHQLPDMLGLELLERSLPCPVVMLTGVGDEQVAVAAMKAGALDYLVKGRLTPEALRRAVDHAVERARLARQLADLEQRTQHVLASITDGFVTLTPDFCFQFVNAAAEGMMRAPAARVLGQSLWTVFPWLLGSPLEQGLRQAMQQRSAFQQEVYVAARDRWFEARVSPVEPGLAVYCCDISARKRHEAQAQRASQRMAWLHQAGVAVGAARSVAEVAQVVTEQAARVFSAACCTLALCAPEGETLEVAGSHGYSDQERQGWALLPLAAPLPLCEAVRARQVVLLRNPEEATLWYPRLFEAGVGSGRQAWAAVPLVSGQVVVGALGLAWEAPQPFDSDDLLLMLAFAELAVQALSRARLHESEQQLRAGLERRVEERTAELRRSNNELEQFAYVASHDLKEPLRIVASYTQLLATRYAAQLDERAQRYAEFIVNGTTRMHRLIEDLLSVSRVGTQESLYVPTDLETLFDNLLAALGSGAPVTRGPLPNVVADPTQLSSLFQNLLSNALKFRRPEAEPEVHVSARREGSVWQFSVADNGIGIAPEYHEQVFVIFQRLHGREHYEGNGIGLAICAKIVNRHGGRIWLDSSPGTGTTVHFTLPAIRGPT